MREDWIGIELAEITVFALGGDWGKAEDFQDENFDAAYCIRGAEFKNWDVDFGKTASLRQLKKNSIEKRNLVLGDILVEISGGGPEQPVGRTEVISQSVLNNFNGSKLVCTNFLRLIRLSKFANSEFTNWYLKYFYSTGKIRDYQAGSNNLRNLKFNKYLTLGIPIAPIPEQRAIVAKIEELFSDLDKGIADLKKAQDQLKVYRQAVLKKAFEGEFNQVKVIEIADVNTGATPKRGNVKYWENGNIPWVTSGVVNKPFVNEPSEHITDIAIKETNCKIIEKGSLLVAMYGEGKTRGKCCELNIDAATNQALAAITLKEETQYSKEFVKWFFVKNYGEIRLLSSGGVQPNLNLTLIKNTILPFPSEEVQHQIVQEIESRLSVCDGIEESITESLEKAKALRQSVLKKAFEGTLLSKEEIAACKAAPDYEPASVLLEKIKAEKKKK